MNPNVFRWLSMILMGIVAVVEAREMRRASDRGMFQRSALLALLSVLAAGLLMF